MAELAQALGKQSSTLEFDGKTYTLTELALDEWAPFEVWLEQEAYKGARRVLANPHGYGLSPAEAQANFERIAGDVAAQVYSFGSERFLQAMNTLAGKKQVCWLMMAKNHPSIPRSLVDKMFLQMFAEVIAAMDAAEGQSPNPPPPPSAEATGALPKSSPPSAVSPGVTGLKKSVA